MSNNPLLETILEIVKQSGELGILFSAIQALPHIKQLKQNEGITDATITGALNDLKAMGKVRKRTTPDFRKRWVATEVAGDE